MREQKATIHGMTAKALERLVDRAVKDDGVTDAYLCRLQLPRQFTSNVRESNDIYKKIISDFGKNVMRRTGETPRYITVKTENATNPEYAFCLFTRHNASLDKPEEYAEKGREIANGKVGQAGWGNGKLDVVEMIMDSPKFIIGSEPVQITSDNKDDAIGRLQEHLKCKSESNNHQRTLFVSKCP